MRTTFILATFVASVLAIFAAIEVHAQQPHGSAPSVHCPVACIDIGTIFKNHAGLKQSKLRLDQDKTAAQEALKKDGAHLNSLVEQLKQLKPGTPDYKKREEEAATLQAQIQTHANLLKKDFVERESKMYYAVYQEVTDAVRYFADRNGISLVLQCPGDQVDPNNPQSIMNQITGPVVYQHGVDITQIILEDLNRNFTNRNSTARPGTGPLQR